MLSSGSSLVILSFGKLIFPHTCTVCLHGQTVGTQALLKYQGKEQWQLFLKDYFAHCHLVLIFTSLYTRSKIS